MQITANDNGVDNVPLPKKTKSQMEEQLVRDDFTNELYMPLSSTIVLKRKKKMLYVPMVFESGLTIDALVDSRAYVSEIAQTELDRTSKKLPPTSSKTTTLPISKSKSHGQLEKPITTTISKFDIGDNNFAEHFVVMKSLTGSIMVLHFMRHNSLVNDTTHGLIHMPHLTMQAKNAAYETSAKPKPVFVQDNTT